MHTEWRKWEPERKVYLPKDIKTKEIFPTSGDCHHSSIGVRCLQNTWCKSAVWFEYSYGYLAGCEHEENPSWQEFWPFAIPESSDQMSYTKSVRKWTSASEVTCCQENEMQGHSLSKFHLSCPLCISSNIFDWYQETAWYGFSTAR